MKKKVMRFALLSVLPVAAVFVFSAYTGNGSDSRCPAVDPLDRVVKFPNPDDCGSYFQCSNGVAILMKCDDGLHYNANLELCDWPWYAGCEDPYLGHSAPLQRMCEYYGYIFEPISGEYIFGHFTYYVTTYNCLEGWGFCDETTGNPCPIGQPV